LKIKKEESWAQFDKLYSLLPSVAFVVVI